MPPELVVLESVAAPTERTNPYLPLLVASFPPTVSVRWFSWRFALAGSFDVLHLHWPEVRLRGSTRIRSWARWALFLLVLLRIRVQRKALVRTLHNAEPHEPLSGAPRALLRLCERWTTAWIVLSDATTPPGPGAVHVIPHGHYRPWFAGHPRSAPVRGRLLHLGLVRRYKGVEALLQAFMQTDDPDLSLRIVGSTVDPEVGVAIREAVTRDARITAVDEYVPDDVVVREISESELVVLPFASFTSSGSLLLALSLDRPVLVPGNEVTLPLRAEVGAGWVLTYGGPLDAEALVDALEAVRVREEGSDGPDLGRREWDEIGKSHLEAFASAFAEVRGRSRRVPPP